MGVDVITLALAKSYTDNSIKGTTGPIAGKNCTIASIQKTLHSNIVTFKWTADDGTTQTRTMEVKDGNNVVDVQFVEETEDTETYEFVMENGDTHEFTIPRGYSPKIEEHTKTENVYTLDIYQRVEASVEKTTTPNLKGASTKAEINSETENLYNLKITTYDGNETSVIITPNMLGKKWWVGELVTRHTDPETGEYLPISTDTVPDSTVGDLYLNSKNDFVFQRIDDVIVQEQVVQQWKFLGCIAGEDNYTLWKKIPGNEGKTIVEYFEFLSGEGIPCHIVVSKPDSKEPTTLEKHWYYYQNDVESNRIPGYIDNTAWWYDIQPLEHLTEIKIGKYACYTGQMYINGEVTHEYAHVEGYQAKLYWHDLRENGGKCRVIVFNVATGAVVMAGDEVDVFYSTEPVEGYEIHPVNIIPLGSWYQTMYIKDTTGGVVNHEITIAPQETYGSFVEQQTFNNVIGIGELPTTNKQVKGAIAELYNRKITTCGVKRELNDPDFWFPYISPTYGGGQNQIPFYRSGSWGMYWLKYPKGTAQEQIVPRDSTMVPSCMQVSNSLPTINDNHEYTIQDNFYTFTNKATNVYKYPMADSQGYPTWVNTDTFFGNLLDGLKEKFWPIGTYVMGDHLISMGAVISVYGGTQWVQITGALYGVGDQILGPGSVAEELPNIKSPSSGVGPIMRRGTFGGAFVESTSNIKQDEGNISTSYVSFDASSGQVKEDGSSFVPQSESVYKNGGHVFSKGRSTYIWMRTA